MSRDDDAAASVVVRRAPRPLRPGATITQLVPPGGRRTVIPLASLQGTLALDLDVPPPAPAAPELHLVPVAPTAELREIEAWSAKFAQAMVEVLGGDRPLSQLLRWTTLPVYRDLERRLRILNRVAPAGQRQRTVRPQVCSVRVCQPALGVAEVSVRVRQGPRSRAIAARLELQEARWRCVVLELG